MKKDKDKSKKNALEIAFATIFYLYPFFVIGLYYLGYSATFYICSFLMLIFELIFLIVRAKYGLWKENLLSLILLFIGSEIGYLMARNIIDGICLGVNLLIIGSMVAIYITKKNKT